MDAMRKQCNRDMRLDLTHESCSTDKGRFKNKGGGTKERAPILGEELFQWFVGTLHTTTCRIGSPLLLRVAVAIKNDIIAGHQSTLEEHGEARGLKLPVLTTCWLHRWRVQYGVSLRRVNLVYKVSHAKLLHRLRVFWSNVIRIRAFWEHLHKDKPLRFISCDQNHFGSTT